MKTAFVLIPFLVAIDQLTKYLVRAQFALGESLPLLPFFQLTYVTNTGAAFGMFGSAQKANVFFIIFTVAVLVGSAVWYMRQRALLPRPAHAALLLITAGALGNLIDRVALGFVTDFLDVYAGSVHWPAFNVADSCLTVGGILLAYCVLMDGRVPQALKEKGENRE